MSGNSNRISIKVKRNIENSLRQIALRKNRIYGGRGSIAHLVEAIGLEEIPLLPLAETEKLPAIPAIFFCTNKNGKILYISKTLNLKERWSKQEYELKNIIQNDAIGIFWISCTVDTMEDIVSYLIDNLKPELNNLNPVVFASDDYYINSEEQEILDLEGQRSLHKAFFALIEKKQYSDARKLFNIFEKYLKPKSQLFTQMQSTLREQDNWLQKIEKLISDRIPFVLTNGNHRHCCKYAEFWENDGTTYLRCWVENATVAGELPELSHNRIYSLENPIQVEPFPQSFWRYEGLDSIKVTLHLQPVVRYKPKLEDSSCRCVFVGEGQRIEIVKKVHNLTWFFQSLQRYGDKIAIVEPDYVKIRFINYIDSILNIYRLP